MKLKHLKTFEELTSKDIVSVKGEKGKGKVVNQDGDMVDVYLFKSKETVTVKKKKVQPIIKCIGQCDKKIVKEDGKRVIKCMGCGKIKGKYKKKGPRGIKN